MVEEKHKSDQDPWYPTIEREPLLNPFANPLSRIGGSDNPAPSAEFNVEDEAAVEETKPTGL